MCVYIYIYIYVYNICICIYIYIYMLRGGILTSTGRFLEMLRRRILAGIILVGRLAVVPPSATRPGTGQAAHDDDDDTNNTNSDDMSLIVSTNDINIDNNM